MKIVEQRAVIETPLDRHEVLTRIERFGRVCCKSEDKITDDSAERFVKMLIKRGHESVLEHVSITVRFICDRGLSHEIVRHRIASYSQESTRYCTYKDKDIEFIMPTEIKHGDEADLVYFNRACNMAETAYNSLIGIGKFTSQTARAVLPMCLKTELVMTANLREWRHFLQLRTSAAAHPDMRELASGLLKQLTVILPEIFGDIGGKIET